MRDASIFRNAWSERSVATTSKRRVTGRPTAARSALPYPHACHGSATQSVTLNGVPAVPHLSAQPPGPGRGARSRVRVDAHEDEHVRQCEL